MSDKQSIRTARVFGKPTEIARFRADEASPGTLVLTARTEPNIRATTALLLSLGVPVEAAVSYRRETRNRVRWAIATTPDMGVFTTLSGMSEREVAHRVIDVLSAEVVAQIKAARETFKAANPAAGYQAPVYSASDYDSDDDEDEDNDGDEDEDFDDDDDE